MDKTPTTAIYIPDPPHSGLNLEIPTTPDPVPFEEENPITAKIITNGVHMLHQNGVCVMS